jgi:hypothetical protein
LFTGIEGSAAMASRLEDARAGILADHHGLICTAVAHGSRVVVC